MLWLRKRDARITRRFALKTLNSACRCMDLGCCFCNYRKCWSSKCNCTNRYNISSNIGTFALYALICTFTIVAFVGRHEFHGIKHAVVPVLGVIGNLGLLVAVVYYGLITPGVSADGTKMALYITFGWGLISVLYLVWNSRQAEGILYPPPNS